MKREAIVLTICYLIIAAIILVASKGFRKELLVAFGLYTYMILMGLWIAKSEKKQVII